LCRNQTQGAPLSVCLSRRFAARRPPRVTTYDLRPTTYALRDANRALSDLRDSAFTGAAVLLVGDDNGVRPE
jgi:hypothetical protein